jgi:transcriptional antiterminator RfaH
MFWSVVQTETLRERTALRWLETDFECYLPLMRAANARVVPLFPCYLFVKLEEAGGWSRIENSIGVIALLKSGDRPARLPDVVVPLLRAKERNGIVRLPKPRGILRGDKVQIVRGSFAECLGMFDGMASKHRVWVLLDLFGRKTRTEFERDDVRPIQQPES